MDSGETPLGRPVRTRPYYRTPGFLRLSDLRTLRKCEKVAAVCFRVRAGIIEFLLVQTRGGRWTFPKGNAEPGLTTAQAAALEAFEEAGVHGRMEEISFATYVRPRRGIGGKPESVELMVTAHLCEVLWLDSPQESGRNPTWFSPERAKRRLREDRSAGYGMELARVVDRAATRIRQLRSHPILQITDGINIDDIRSRPRTKALPPARHDRRNKPTSEK
jgi:8-oxo-dGTP pyrophosphatase MutT (NUDIX family)